MTRLIAITALLSLAACAAPEGDAPAKQVSGVSQGSKAFADEDCVKLARDEGDNSAFKSVLAQLRPDCEPAD